MSRRWLGPWPYETRVDSLLKRSFASDPDEVSLFVVSDEDGGHLYGVAILKSPNCVEMFRRWAKDQKAITLDGSEALSAWQRGTSMAGDS